jgi:hypothetical protein
MPESVQATDKKQKDLFYGAPCLPTVKGILWKCRDRPEYIEHRSAFEELEANCNTCANLVRFKQKKCPSGFMEGRCQLINTNVRFHPEDPQGCKCWQSRRTASEQTQHTKTV